MKRFVAAIAVAVSALVVPMLNPTSANAYPAGCVANRLCFFIDSNFGNYDAGAPGQVTGDNPLWSAFTRSTCVPPHATVGAHGTWNDCASSMANTRATLTFVLNYDSNYNGSYFLLQPGQNMANLPSGFNDQVSSDYLT